MTPTLNYFHLHSRCIPSTIAVVRPVLVDNFSSQHLECIEADIQADIQDRYIH